MDEIEPSLAREALDEIDAARRGVDAADRRGTPALLVATAALTFLDFAAKDHAARPVRHAVTAVVQTALLGMSLAEVRANPVVPYEPADGPAPGRATAVFGAIAGWTAAERAVVVLLRRSRLRRPNTVAGLVLAVTRPAGHVVLRSLLPRAGRHV